MDEFPGARSLVQPPPVASAALRFNDHADTAFQRLTRLAVQLLEADWACLILTGEAGPVAQTGPLPPDLDLHDLPPESGFALAQQISGPDGPGGWLLVGTQTPRCWTDKEQQALGDLAALAAAELDRQATVLALDAERAAHRVQQGTLQGTREQLMMALESAPLVLWATDTEGRFTLSEGRALHQLNSRPGQLVGRTVSEVLSHVPGVRENMARTLNGETFTTNIVMNGRTYESSYSPLLHPDGRVSGALGVAYDVTELLHSQQSAQLAKDQAEILLELSRVLDVDGDLQDAASAALGLLSRGLGKGYMGLWQHQDGLFRSILLQGEVPDSLRDFQQRGISDHDHYGQALLSGQTLFIDPHDIPERARTQGLHGAALLPVTLESETGVLILGAYRTEPRPWSEFERELLIAAARTLQVSVQRRHATRLLQQAAHTEPLTGLGNRRAFHSDLEAALAVLPVTLVSVDLDGLKRVNDQGGHHRGDALLQTYGAALQTCFQADSRLYRLGGDEFVIIVAGIDLSAAELERRMAEAERLVRAAGFGAAASAGAASAPRDGHSAAELIRLSDARMYEAKAARRRVSPA